MSHIFTVIIDDVSVSLITTYKSSKHYRGSVILKKVDRVRDLFWTETIKAIDIKSSSIAKIFVSSHKSQFLPYLVKFS